MMMMLLQITSTEDGFRLEGELDMSTVEDLSKVLDEDGTAEGPLILDFSGVSFMDSSGLRVLLEAARNRSGGGRLVILHPASQVQRVLEISIPGGTPGLEVRT
jgi:anti-anti-sigma factor